MYRLLYTATLVLAFGLSFAANGWCQGRSFGTGMSAFGTGGMGSSGFGSGFGRSGFGSGGFGSGGFGGGGFGASGFGASSFGRSGFGGMMGGNTGFGGFGSPSFGGGFGSQSFGMGGIGGGQNFIGRDSADMAATFSDMSRAGTQFFNQAARQMRRGNRENQAVEAFENPPQPLRVELQIAFNAPQPAPIEVAASLRTRLAKILASHQIAQPVVTLEGDTAVLSGIAATESQRLVLEKLISLEPGVRQVRNEMVVAGVPPQSAPLSPGN